jgi:hypothetical protein
MTRARGSPLARVDSFIAPSVPPSGNLQCERHRHDAGEGADAEH